MGSNMVYMSDAIKIIHRRCSIEINIRAYSKNKSVRIYYRYIMISMPYFSYIDG